jgi:methionyl-tRNA synthetase
MDFSRALETLWSLVAAVDGYLTASAPWKKSADLSDEVHASNQARVLATAAEAIRIITALAHPILPESTAKVWRQLGLGEIEEAAQRGELKELSWGGLRAGTQLNEPSPLFPRAEKDAVERMENLEKANNLTAVAAAGGVEDSTKSTEASSPAVVSEATALPSEAKVASIPAATVAPAHEPEVSSVSTVETPTTPAVSQIGIEDFAKVELRVAQILVAERIPKADKLLRLEVDLGYEKRQILAGIAQYYDPEKLIGRKVVIVANLAPRKMRGLESNGMIVAASLGDQGAPVLAGFLEDVPIGARLK